jgi:hypothetical protein
VAGARSAAAAPPASLRSPAGAGAARAQGPARHARAGSAHVKFPHAVPIRVKDMTEPADSGRPAPQTVSAQPSRAAQPVRRARDARGDPYLKSMLLGLIEDSYLHTGTFTQFAAEVLQVLAYAVTVPVAFTEGFLRAYLSIDRVVEEDDGRIIIVPKKNASIEDLIRDVDEITAQVDPGAVFNPVVRARLDAVHQVSGKAMKWDIDDLSRMDDGQLMDVLREMQAESERLTDDDAPAADDATDFVRAKLATIRRNVRRFQAQQASGGGAREEEPGPA